MTDKQAKESAQSTEGKAQARTTHRLDDTEIEDLSDLDLDEFVAEMGGSSAASSSIPSSAADVLGGQTEIVDPHSGKRSTADEKVARLQDRLMRVAADFDNFRKRARRETEEAAHKSGQTVLRAILPIIDNLERAVDSQGDNRDPEATLEGVRMVLKQLESELRRIQVETVETIGNDFDPQFHEAFEKVDSPGHAPGTIVAELQKGYLFQTRLLRPALVSIASKESGTDDEKGVARVASTDLNGPVDEPAIEGEPFAALEDLSETESADEG